MNTNTRTPDSGAPAQGNDAADPHRAELNQRRFRQQLGPDAGRVTLRRRLADLIARGPLPCEPAAAWDDAARVQRKNRRKAAR